MTLESLQFILKFEVAPTMCLTRFSGVMLYSFIVIFVAGCATPSKIITPIDQSIIGNYTMDVLIVVPSSSSHAKIDMQGYEKFRSILTTMAFQKLRVLRENSKSISVKIEVIDLDLASMLSTFLIGNHNSAEVLVIISDPKNPEINYGTFLTRKYIGSMSVAELAALRRRGIMTAEQSLSEQVIEEISRYLSPARKS